MTKTEKIQYQNLKYKLEKLQATFDIVEQENNEYKKEITKLKKEKETLEKNNSKLGDIATKKYDEL